LTLVRGNFHSRLRFAAVGIVLLNLPGVLAAFYPTPLRLNEWLVYFDPWIVIFVIVPLYIMLLPALPFLVQKEVPPNSTPSTERTGWLAATALILVSFEFLWWVNILIGTFCRGPNWNFYWPWEPQIPRVEAFMTFNLSDWWWKWLCAQPLPPNLWLRELPGLSFLFVWLLILPMIGYILLRSIGSRMTWWRMLTYLFIIQLAMLLPLKMFGRHFVNLKYIVSIPEMWFNV